MWYCCTLLGLVFPLNHLLTVENDTPKSSASFCRDTLFSKRYVSNRFTICIFCILYQIDEEINKSYSLILFLSKGEQAHKGRCGIPMYRDEAAWLWLLGGRGINIHQETRITQKVWQKSSRWSRDVFWCCGLSWLFKGRIVMNIFKAVAIYFI